MKKSPAKTIVLAVLATLIVVCICWLALRTWGNKPASQSTAIHTESQTDTQTPPQAMRDDSFKLSIDTGVGGGFTGESAATVIRADGSVTRETTMPNGSVASTKLGMTTPTQIDALEKALPVQTLQTLVAADKGAQYSCSAWDITRESKDYTLHFCTLPDELKTAQQLANDIFASVTQ